MSNSNPSPLIRINRTIVSNNTVVHEGSIGLLGNPTQCYKNVRGIYQKGALRHTGIFGNVKIILYENEFELVGDE
jgi:hypothetical protein